MSQKKNPDQVNKDVMIRVRVTADEREKFNVLAKEKDYSTVSEFIWSLVANDSKNDHKKISTLQTQRIQVSKP